MGAMKNNLEIYRYLKDLIEHYTKPIHTKMYMESADFRRIENTKTQGLIIVHDLAFKDISFVFDKEKPLIDNSFANLSLLQRNVDTKSFNLYTYSTGSIFDNDLERKNNIERQKHIDLIALPYRMGLFEYFMMYAEKITGDDMFNFFNCDAILNKYIWLLTSILLRTTFNNQDITIETLQENLNGLPADYYIGGVIASFIADNYIDWITDYLVSLGYDENRTREKANAQIDTSDYHKLIHNLGNM